MSLLAIALVLAIGSILFLTTRGGITGAVTIEPAAISIQAVNTTSACGILTKSGDTYELSQNVSSISTCFSILAGNITIDCKGFNITYGSGGSAGGIGINNTGGYDNVTIKNCVIFDDSGSTTFNYGIHFLNVANSTITATTISTKTGSSHGIVLEGSNSNLISLTNITTSVSGTSNPAYGILINGTSDNNLLLNLNFSISAGSDNGRYSINNLDIGTTAFNTLIYNNSQGQINWTKANLTTTLNLSIGKTVFVENNLVGLISVPCEGTGCISEQNINSTARIEIRNLTYQVQPDLLKAGVRCDGLTAGICNISYDAALRILFANVSSFSNYSTQENDPPNVTIFTPVNGTNFSLGLQDFNVTVFDMHSAVSVVVFQFTNGTNPSFNRTASNNSINASVWNVTGLNWSIFAEGTIRFRVFANDTLNNVNNSQFIDFTIDRTPPTVNITAPLNRANFSFGSPLQDFNTTVSDATTSVGTVIFYFSNGTVATGFNRTASNSSGNWNVSGINLSSLVEGTTTIKVFANDTLNNRNDTETITITVDRTAPNVSIVNPSNASNFTSGLQAFNVSVLDNITQVQTVLLMFNTNNTAFNITLTNVSGNWNANVNMLTLNEGPHTVRVYANDTVNNVNTTQTLAFTVDRTAPTVNITGPSAGATLSGTQVFNATVRDNATLVNAVIFQFTNGTNPAFNRTASNTSGYWNVSLDTASLAEGSQTVTVFANDTVNNVNVPSAANNGLRSFEIDNIPATTSGGAGSTAASGTTAAASTTAATTTATTTSTTAAPSTEAASTQQISNALQSGSLAISTGPKTEAGPGEAAAGGISRSLTEVETSELKIVNHLDKKVRLAAELREEDFKIENEDKVKQRIREELLQQGDTSEEAVNKRLEELKLLEQVEVLQVYKTRLSRLLPKALTGAATASPLTPTKKQISARLLKDLLVNADELQNIEIDPGETLTAEIKFRRGLSLDPVKSTKLVFFSEGKEVLVEDLGEKEELVVGTAIDVNPETKQFDFYIFIPPQKEGGEEFFSAELDLNVRKPMMKSLSLPLKVMLPLFFTERPKTIYGEWYGPYKVNRQKGALLAVQYDASALEGEYEIVGRVYNEGNVLLAENHFGVQS